MSRLLAFFFDTVGGKAIAAVAGLAALVVAFAWDQRSTGRNNAIVEINQAARETVEDARRARARVPDGGNVRWLQQHRCRDC